MMNCKGMKPLVERLMKRNDEIPAVTNLVDLTNLPDLTDIYELAYKVLEELPKKFRIYTQDILVRVENFPDQQTLNSLKLESKYDLLGLYRGIPIPMKSSHVMISIPDTIFLYRCPIVRFSEDNDQALEELVQHVMIHEIGHHFGFSDFDMEWIQRTP